MSVRSQAAPTEAPPPPGSTEKPPPNPAAPSDFAEEPTMPAINLSKPLRDLGEDPTLPAIDLQKELARAKKPS